MNVKTVEHLCLRVTHKGTQLRNAVQIGSRVSFTRSTEDFESGTCPLTHRFAFVLWIDILHGGYPNGWKNLCHWADSLFPLYIAASQGGLAHVTDVFLWQVQRSAFSVNGAHSTLLQLVLNEASKHSNGSEVRLHFDEDIPVGRTFYFERATTVEFPRKRAQFASHFIGCSRGFGSLELRLRYRQGMLRLLSVETSPKRQILYMPRMRVKLSNLSQATRLTRQYGFELVVASFRATVPYRLQVKAIASAHILVGAHGAGMVHMPLLQPVGGVVELFNCNHTSFMYRNLAMYSGLYYEAVYSDEQCRFAPPMPLGASTRSGMDHASWIPYERWTSSVYRAMRYVHWGSWD